MNRRTLSATLAATLAASAFLTGCGKKEKADPQAEAPPQTTIVEQSDVNLIKVDNPSRFSTVAATSQEDVPEVQATGVVSPDVDRSIPVTSLASGRVVEIDAKLGDDVRKGQLLLKIVSNDIAAGFQNYAQAQADEALAKKQLDRARLLYDRGAISLNDLQVAENAENKAAVAVSTSAQQVKVMGGDLKTQSPIINVYAPASGTIVEQNVVRDAAVHTPDNQQNLFTIADLSKIWILCDVYENDLPMVRLGDHADISLNAYPDRTFRGVISNIGKVLDPNLRTAKVRIDLNNPGIMRAGMFVRATFYGLHGKSYAAVPSGAVLHLHDRDWVYVPAPHDQFRRVEIKSGKTKGDTVQVLSGLSPGQQVVQNALALNAESEQ